MTCTLLTDCAVSRSSLRPANVSYSLRSVSWEFRVVKKWPWPTLTPQWYWRTDAHHKLHSQQDWNPETRTNKAGQLVSWQGTFTTNSIIEGWGKPQDTRYGNRVISNKPKQCRKTTRYATASFTYGTAVGVTTVKNLDVGKLYFLMLH
jgi:hypothetical protein